MRIRHGDSNRLIRRFAAGAGLIMLLLLGGRYIGRAAGGIQENDCKRMIKAGGEWLVETLWDQTHPRERISEENKGTKGMNSTDPDPAYGKYQAAKTFYEEHQYLAWYGNEESGQQSGEEEGQQMASAGAQAKDQKMPEPDRENASGRDAGSNPPGVQAADVTENSIRAASDTLTGAMNRPITGNTYVMEQLADYDFLMKHFYSVHTSTTAGRDLMDAKKLLTRDMSMKGDPSKPQILIYHTHSQEAFKDSGPGQTVVGLGTCLTGLLEAKGYNVYHDTTVYDLRNGQLDRSKAYNYALDGITNILQKNPSIEVVLDIHRDGVGENLHLITQVDGRDTAQIMFFDGLSQTPEGPIEYLKNPYREDNLAFSLQMQLDAAAYYPGFTRKIYLKGLRYNEHVRPKSCLIEVGAQTNTYQEALNAMEPLSELLDMVLSGK